MKRFQGIFFGILAASAFGMIPLFAVPVLRSGMNTSSVLFYRMFFSILLLGLLLLIKRADMRITRRQLLVTIGLSVLYTASSLYLLESYLYIPSGIATTIHFLYPVFVTIMMVGVFKEKLSLAMALSIVLGVGGVYLLSTGSGDGQISFTGVWMVLITVVAYGGYLVGVNNTSANRVNSLVLTFYVLFFTTIFCGINLLFSEKGLEMIPDSSVAANLLMLGFIPTLVSNLFLILAIHRIGSTVTAVLGCMEPLTAVGMGVLFLGEKLEGMQYVGIIVVVVAVALVILGRKKG